MQFYLDSSNPKEVEELFKWGVLSGVTTNPLIISREMPGADLEDGDLSQLNLAGLNLADEYHQLKAQYDSTHKNIGEKVGECSEMVDQMLKFTD